MPIDRGILDQQIQALGESSHWWEQRELRDLPAVLHADEQVLAIARGKVARPRVLHRSWLIVVTDGRLLCLRSANRGTWSQLEVSGKLITRVSLRIGPFRGRIVVVAGGHTYRLLVRRPDAYKLSSALATIGPAKGDSTHSFRPTIMARRVIDHVLALPAIALNPDSEHARRRQPEPADKDPALAEHVETLEEQVEQLRQQVDFLEQLLHQQQVGAGADRRLPPD